MKPDDTSVPLLAAAAASAGQPADGASTLRVDLVIVAALSVATFLLASRFELNETIVHWTRPAERFQLDELPMAFLVLALSFAWFSWRRWKEIRRELQRRAAAERELERSELQYRMLSRRCILIQEAERRRIARELHDELGQYLNAIKVDAVGIREASRATLPEIHASASSIVDFTDHVYGVVRSLVGQLRPVALDELGLAAALQHCVDGWRRRLPGTEFSFVASGALDDLDEQTNMTLYRVAQECLTNVARHARARRVVIGLSRTADGTAVRLSVSDDGVGMDAAAAQEGMGLAGMRERIAALGGRLEIVSAPGSGLGVHVAIPLQAERESHGG